MGTKTTKVFVGRKTFGNVFLSSLSGETLMATLASLALRRRSASVTFHFDSSLGHVLKKIKGNAAKLPD